MREVNKASIAMTLRSQGSLGRGEGGAPGLDGVFSKPEAVPIHIDTDENDPAIHHLHSDGLSSALAAELLKKFGRNELPEKKTPKWKIVSGFLFSLSLSPSLSWMCSVVCWRAGKNVPPSSRPVFVSCD